MKTEQLKTEAIRNAEVDGGYGYATDAKTKVSVWVIKALNPRSFKTHYRASFFSHGKRINKKTAEIIMKGN